MHSTPGRRHVDVVAVLEVMWGEPSDEAPGFFWINDKWNASGKRLRQLVGTRVLVTNACRECVPSASHRGTRDPDRLARNLSRIDCDLLLICGAVAQATFEESGFVVPEGTRAFYMKHPAARSWTKQEIEETSDFLTNLQAAR